MSLLRSILKSVLPLPARNFLRSIYKLLPLKIRCFLGSLHRDVVFRGAMKQFIKNPATFAQSGNPVLADLIYGWGNEKWSALDEYLASCINHAIVSPGEILECGSGLSSILISAVAKKQNQCHLILEHNPEWADKVQSYLDRYKLDSTIYTKPLMDYGDFCWYDVQEREDADSFFLVVCDGPPGSTKGGRYGLIPTMRKSLASGCVILLDDAGREAELEAAKHWAAELNTSFSIQGKNKPYIKIVLP
jgi:hypothetical protein